MLVVHNPLHHLHQGRQEMFRGRLVDCHETPARLTEVLAELQRRGIGPLHAAVDAGAALDAALAHFAARLGLFSFDAGTPLTAGSWAAARGGAACAIAAAAAVVAARGAAARSR